MNIRGWTAVWLGLLLFALTAAGCGQANGEAGKKSEESGPLQVVTSFYPLYDFARAIGGEHAHVVSLIPAGVDSHDWSPKPQDLIKVSEADLFIYAGLGFEGWANSLLGGLDPRQMPTVVIASEGIEPIRAGHSGHEDDSDHARDDHDGHDGHSHGMYDPHVWLSPLQAMKWADNIYQAFVAADGSHAADYEANYKQLMEKLEMLHAEYDEAFRQAARKDLIVSHDALGYVARDYGLKQIPVMGLSPEAEPTAADIRRILDYIREEGISYILFEEVASPKLARTLAKDAGIETLEFNPLEGLTEAQIAAGEDYFSIMRSNLDAFKQALQR